ncbi:MAG: aminotransferase class I/II-fold pyridoxal phosphate-dependent enzyme [Lachnospiraceae bacterium]|nr:aminotransferase class I/II-fold pyridoxal phosphate-dependent enzyme [Lachnospiraceae bacterium]
MSTDYDFNLEQQLHTYVASDALPMHMPGHKRNSGVFHMSALQDIDITEIYGFDDLHDPSGILKDSQSAAAALYGADRSFYLVNGSTVGILAGISACVKPGDRILMARNCHLSVYHAVILNALRPDYIFPPVHPDYGFAGSIKPRDIEAALAAAEQAGEQHSLVVVTSPAYEGVISDIRQISEICHAYNVPLLVDEAHGAHLSVKGKETAETACSGKTVLGERPGTENRKSGTVEDAGTAVPYFPFSAISLGADIVVQSLHKTLPAPTQTGILHCRAGFVEPEKIKRYLDIYQTSSPSYVLLCGIENALRFRSRPDWDGEWLESLNRFYKKTGNLKTLRIIPPGGAGIFFDRDPSKIVISAAGTGRTGNDLMTVLREEYNIETEMAAGSYVIAMTGAGDTKESLDRLAEALKAIHAAWTGCEEDHGSGMPEKESFQCRTGEEREVKKNNPVWETAAASRMNKSMTPAEAFHRDSEPVNLRDAEGKTAGGIVTVYPPGIPVIVPGEKITSRIIEVLIEALQSGLHVAGLAGRERIKTVKM